LSENRVLTSSFPICIPFLPSFFPSFLPSFLPLTLLLWLRILMLKKSGESQYPCLILHFRRKVFSFSPFSIMLDINLSHITFVMLRFIPCISSLLRLFIMKGCWICKCFFHICWGNQVILSFILHVCYTIFINLHPWSKTNLIIVCNLWNVLLNSICKYFIEDVCVYIHEGNLFIVVLLYPYPILVLGQ
jgi:hypothetical protein